MKGERTILMDHKDAPAEALAALVHKHGVEKQAWWCGGTLAAAAPGDGMI